MPGNEATVVIESIAPNSYVFGLSANSPARRLSIPKTPNQRFSSPRNNVHCYRLTREDQEASEPRRIGIYSRLLGFQNANPGSRALANACSRAGCVRTVFRKLLGHCRSRYRTKVGRRG